MNKINELIAEFCPDGVEYKSIAELFNTKNGYTPSKSHSEYWENGTIPWFRMEDIRENGRILSKATQYVSESAVKGTLFPANSIIVATSATIGEHALIKVPSLANQRFTYLMLKEEYSTCMDIMFVYYYCFKLDEYCKVCLNQGNFASVDMKKFVKFKFPVPPLEVQREIVRVLDSFTLLTAELTAELTARKKQYSFYRDSLLKQECKSEKIKLKAVCAIYDGTHQTPKYTNSGIPFVSVENIDNLYGTQKYISPEAYAKYKIKPRIGDVFMTRITAGVIGKCTVVDRDDDLAYYVSLALLRPNAEVLDSKYLKYYLESGWGRKELSKWILWDATPTKINKDDIGRVLISIPPLDVQKRLVQVIEHFDTICTDLNIGLPAEIEARQKQYEYYRDLLLTFAETGSTLVTDRQTDLSAIKLIQYVFGYVTLPMGSLFDFRNGLSKGKDFFGTGTPFIRYIDVYNNRFLREDDITALVECTPAEIEKLKVHRGDVFFTRTSETAEDVGWSSVMLDDIGDCVFNGFTIKATPKTNYLLPEYCAFCFATDDFRQYVTSHCAFTTRASLTGKTIAEYQLAFPSIEKQQEMVDILSKFHTLCNDLSAGLPAEIEARQKQYEYYRDKLLSFKEIQK